MTRITLWEGEAQQGLENVGVTIYLHKANFDEEQVLCLIRKRRNFNTTLGGYRHFDIGRC